MQDFTFPLDYLLENRNKRLGILHGIVSCESNKSDQFIHCWDGKDFFELTSFKYPKDIIERSCNLGKSLEGAQITARSMQSVLLFFSLIFRLASRQRQCCHWLICATAFFFFKCTICTFVVENMVSVRENLTKIFGVIPWYLRSGTMRQRKHHKFLIRQMMEEKSGQVIE